MFAMKIKADAIVLHELRYFVILLYGVCNIAKSTPTHPRALSVSF